MNSKIKQVNNAMNQIKDELIQDLYNSLQAYKNTNKFRQPVDNLKNF